MSTYSNALVPSLSMLYTQTPPNKLMQDNNPKHVSMLCKRIYIWSLQESTGGNPLNPDLNPIENLWQEMKEFIRRASQTNNQQAGHPFQ